MPSEPPSPPPAATRRAWERRELLSGVSRSKALFLLAATLSFLMSVYLFFGGDHERGIFVGLWVPSILSAGALLLGKEHAHD
jgi:hypothetical protein